MNDNYRTLITKVDATYDRIATRHKQHLQCGRGCHSCCRPGLAVSTVEKEALREHIEATPGLATRLLANERDRPFGESRCNFLAKSGECLVYEPRPLICRSHGVPIRTTEQSVLSVSCCELNFEDLPIETLGMADQLNADLINTLLALINEQAFGAEGRERYPLTVQDITRPLDESSQANLLVRHPEPADLDI